MACITQSRFVAVTLSFSPPGAQSSPSRHDAEPDVVSHHDAEPDVVSRHDAEPDVVSRHDAEPDVVSAVASQPPRECWGGGGGSSGTFVECYLWGQLCASALDITGIRRAWSSSSSSSVGPVDNWDAAVSLMQDLQARLLLQQHAQVLAVDHAPAAILSLSVPALFQ